MGGGAEIMKDVQNDFRNLMGLSNIVPIGHICIYNVNKSDVLE